MHSDVERRGFEVPEDQRNDVSLVYGILKGFGCKFPIDGVERNFPNIDCGAVKGDDGLLPNLLDEIVVHIVTPINKLLMKSWFLTQIYIYDCPKGRTGTGGNKGG